jgi:DNA polymerase
MLKMCKPRRPTKTDDSKWHESSEDLLRLYEYCRNDVRAEKALADKLPPLEPRELAVWQFTEELNWRGVPLDLDFAQRAVEIFEAAKEDGEARIKQITNGAVETGGQTARILEFCESKGLKLPNLQKPTVTEVLNWDLRPEVRELLELRAKLSKGASISKYKAMLAKADLEDGRLRDHVRYSGAGPGRWAGKGVQTQNLPRKVDLPKARQFITLSKQIQKPRAMRLIYDNVTQELSSCVRPTFRAPPGYNFVCVDYSAIEARVLAWLTDDPNLEIFRQGGDVYIKMASAIYGREITKADYEERAVGKESELACGYQLWWKTLLTRCWQKEVKIGPALALKTVKLYREKHPKVREFWYNINLALVECILYGETREVGKLRFEKHGSDVRFFFPSGRFIVYNQVSVKRKKPKLQKTKKFEELLKQLGAPAQVIDEACQMHAEENLNNITKPRPVACYYQENSQSYKWVETSTYGGKTTENACQGIAGDLLSSASLRLAANPNRFGYAVMTVHDELVNQQRKGQEDLEGMIREMCRRPWWAKGLPLDGEGWIGKDYRK